MQEMTGKTTEMKYGKLIAYLKEPIDYKVTVVENAWCIESKQFGIQVYELKYDVAWLAFSEMFFSLLDNYLFADDSKLTPKAIELKNQLNDIVDKVELLDEYIDKKVAKIMDKFSSLRS